MQRSSSRLLHSSIASQHSSPLTTLLPSPVTPTCVLRTAASSTSHRNYSNDWGRRWRSTRTRTGGGPCPFQTLGVPKEVQYKIVKTQFLRLALTHHPDTAVTDNDDEKAKAKAVEMFMKVRVAFEQIIELDDGMAGLKSDQDEGMDGDAFNSWFYEETGKYAPDPFDLTLDPETLQEVADASATQAGLDR